MSFDKVLIQDHIITNMTVIEFVVLKKNLTFCGFFSTLHKLGFCNRI